MGLDVDHQACAHDSIAGVGDRLAGAATQCCADAGQELARAEGLGDIVVRAEVEPRDDVGFLTLGRNDDRRDGRWYGNTRPSPGR